MTVESPEPNGPVLGVPKPAVPPVPSRRRGRRLRRKSPTETLPKGQLRMRSLAGAFVMVGISVVLVGMTIAVVGYWPHRGHGGGGAGTGNGSVAGDTRREVTATRHGPHSEKLKLIGPVIMGIGLFIFICANTMLYENRDMETRRLMQKGLYGMAGGLPEGTGPEDGHCPQGDGPKAMAECLEGCYQVDLSCQPCPGSKWSDCYGPTRLQAMAELLQHPTASPALSLRSLRSVPSADANLGIPHRARAESLLCSADCAGGTGGTGGGHTIIDMAGGCPGAEREGAELSPDVQLHAPGHSRSLDLGRPGVLLVAPIKDRKNRSWPRLDHVSLVGYAKLESTGESSDRL
ncbi:T200B protein, partial [Campylorhamphus procurvoides]|nr:T200B protein [Campylorhamphus procurvoides]